MAQFNINETYEFEVVEIIQNSVGTYKLRLKYEDRDTYRCTAFPFQIEEMPAVVYCKVVKLDPFSELPILAQDKGRFLKENYPDGDYAFMIKDILKDPNTDADYYLLEDHFGFSYRCYFKGDAAFSVGEVKTFEVKCDVDKERLNIKTIKFKSAKEEKDTLIACNSQKCFSTYGEFGPENQTVEHKTSIAFTPGVSTADIDKQLPNVLKELAAFLNTEGGTLNIGVNDQGEAVGMLNDYEHLNDGDDKFNGTYKKTTDSYELKIRNAVRRYLGDRANILLQFSFPEKYKGSVCIITAKPAKRPVFFGGTFIYVRTGNQNMKLREEMITTFIQERLGLEIQDIFDFGGFDMNQFNGNITLEDVEQLIKKYYHRTDNTKEHPTEGGTITVDVPKPVVVSKGNPWNYFTFYKNGEYSFQKNKSKETDILFEVCVHDKEKDQRIVLCYDNGFITTVVPSAIYSSRSKDKRRKGGWNTEANLMNVFVAQAYDMIGALSEDKLEGRTFAKAHNVSDFNPVETIGAKGCTFVKSNLGVVKKYIHIHSEHRNVIPNLIFQKRDTTTTIGVPETVYANEIHFLKKL